MMPVQSISQNLSGEVVAAARAWQGGGWRAQVEKQGRRAFGLIAKRRVHDEWDSLFRYVVDDGSPPLIQHAVGWEDGSGDLKHDEGDEEEGKRVETEGALDGRDEVIGLNLETTERARLDLPECDDELEVRVGRNDAAADVLVAVGEARGNHQCARPSESHRLNALVPPRDHRALSDLEGVRRSAFDARVELETCVVVELAIHKENTLGPTRGLSLALALSLSLSRRRRPSVRPSTLPFPQRERERERSDALALSNLRETRRGSCVARNEKETYTNKRNRRGSFFV